VKWSSVLLKALLLIRDGNPSKDKHVIENEIEMAEIKVKKYLGMSE